MNIERKRTERERERKRKEEDEEINLRLFRLSHNAQRQQQEVTYIIEIDLIFCCLNCILSFRHSSILLIERRKSSWSLSNIKQQQQQQTLDHFAQCSA